MEENDLIRVRIDESKQKEIFTKFIDDFNKDFSLASSYLGINNFSLSRYKRAVSKYIPKDIFLKVVEHLNLEQPDILYSGTLNEIRGHYMRKAHSALEEKYGENWAKELTVRRDFKGIRLSDFPDYLFIYLEEIYRQDLFESLFNLFGSMDKTASFLGVSTSRLFFWRNGVQKDYLADKDGLQFIPLDKLRLISQTLVKDYRDEFSKSWWVG